MITIQKSRYGTFNSWSRASQSDRLASTTVLYSDGAVADKSVITYQSRSPVDFLHTGCAEAFGARDCSNLQVNCSVKADRIDVSKLFSGVSLWDAQKACKTAFSAFSFVPPENNVFPFYAQLTGSAKIYVESNVRWMYQNRSPLGDGLSSFYTRTFYRSAAGTQLGQAVHDFVSVDDKGHIVHCFWFVQASVASNPTYVGYQAIVCRVGDCDYYFNGTSWTPSGFTTHRSITEQAFLNAFWSLPVSIFEGWGLALAKSPSLPKTTGKLSLSVVSSSSEEILQELEPSFKVMVQNYLHDVPYPASQSWFQLAEQCIDNMHKVNVNSPLLMKELVDLGMSVGKLVRGDISSLPKSIQQAWLSYRYGVRLTASDLSEVMGALRNELLDTYTPSKFYNVKAQGSVEPIQMPGNHGFCYRKMFYQVRYDNSDYKIMTDIQGLMDWDFWPTLQNDWDLIPFSFVVDWFVNVQGVLEYFDRRIYEEYINVLQVIYSYKDIYYPIAPAFPFDVSDLSITYYDRRLRPTLHVGLPSFEGGSASNVNIIDGAALILQCKS